MLTEVTKLPFAIFQPETAMEAMQRGITLYSDAWSRLAQSFVSAATAEVELMRSMYTPSTTGQEGTVRPGETSDAVHEWLQASQSKHIAFLQRQRQINDDLTASLFSAAQGFVAFGKAEEAEVSRSISTTQNSPSRSSAPKQQAVA